MYTVGTHIYIRKSLINDYIENIYFAELFHSWLIFVQLVITNYELKGKKWHYFKKNSPYIFTDRFFSVTIMYIMSICFTRRSAQPTARSLTDNKHIIYLM